MNGIVQRFTSFEKLIATDLIKALYWIGIILILLAMAFGMVSGFTSSFSTGLITLIGFPLLAIIAIVFWRFLCEIYIVIFGMYNRLGEIQKSLDKN